MPTQVVEAKWAHPGIVCQYLPMSQPKYFQCNWIGHSTVINGKNRQEDTMVTFTTQSTPIQKDQSLFLISFLALILPF